MPTAPEGAKAADCLTTQGKRTSCHQIAHRWQLWSELNLRRLAVDPFRLRLEAILRDNLTYAAEIMARNGSVHPRLVRCPQTRLNAIEHALGRGATKARQPSLLQRIVVRDRSRRHIVRNARPRGVAQGQRQGLLTLVVGIVEHRY